MKPLLIAFSLLFSFFCSAQENAEFRFAYNEKSVTLLSTVEEVSHPLDEDDDLTFTERLNLYIAMHLDETKVFGEDKSSTLLTLRFSEYGVLQEISTLGENAVLNKAAESIFSDFVGHTFHNTGSQGNFAVEYNIPIVIKH